MNSFPLLKATELIHAQRIGHATSHATDLMKLVARWQTGDQNQKKALRGQITDRVALIRRYAKELGEHADGYAYVDDHEVNRALHQIRKSAEEIESAVLSGNDPSNRLKVLRQDVEGVKTRWSRLVNIGDYLKDGKFTEAAREIMTGVPVNVQPIDGKVLFEGKSEFDIRVHAGDLESEIEALKDGDPRKLALQKELWAVEVYLSPNASDQVLDVAFDAIDDLEDAERPRFLEALAARLESVEKGHEAKVNRRIEAIIREAKEKGWELQDERVTRQMEALDREVIAPFAERKKGYLVDLRRHYDALPRRLRTPDLKRQVALAWDGSMLTRIGRAGKGRAKFMVLEAAAMFVLDQVTQQDEVDREFDDIWEEMGPEAGQMLLDVLPVTGTLLDGYSAIAGEEWVTGDDVSGGWDRAQNALWAGVGLVGDVLAVVAAAPSGSASLWANVALRLAKLSKSGSKSAKLLLHLWPPHHGGCG